VEPEKKMLLAAVLLAVAHQDAKNVKYLGVRAYRMKRISELIADEARRFVSSSAFREMCEQIDVEADVLRAMSPAMALDSYNKLMEPHK